jgi:hypothetical protein
MRAKAAASLSPAPLGLHGMLRNPYQCQRGIAWTHTRFGEGVLR